MTLSPVTMSFCRQPQVLPKPSSTGIWAGFNPELIDSAEWPNAPDLSLAIDYAVRDALCAGLTLREMYQQVRSTLVAQGLQPDGLDLDRCVKDHVLLAI
jgi:hypothetical protein